MLCYPFTAPCEKCKRETPRVKNGTCVICAKRDRKAAKRQKKLKVGSPLVSFGVIETLADVLFSVWIRSTRLGCEMCPKKGLKPDELQCAHGFSRAKKRVRFNESNVFALCPGCHMRHTPPGPKWWVWMEGKIGVEEYQRVEFLKDAGPRLYRGDVELIAADYLGRIQRLPPGEVGDWARESAAKILARQKYPLTPLP